MSTQLHTFLNGETRTLLFDLDGELKPVSELSSALIFPGSFNPLHRGHAHMFRLAEKITGLPSYLEISVQNVDKLALESSELEARLNKLRSHFRVLLTQAPRFIEKAQLFQSSTFLMGYDTAKRLIDPAYCKNENVNELLTQFQQLNIKFMIAGRVDGQTFQTRNDLHIPAGFETLFEEMSADLFREDISSSEIRKNRI